MNQKQLTQLIVEDVYSLTTTDMNSRDGLYWFISSIDISPEPRQALHDLDFKRDTILQATAIIDSALVTGDPSFLIDEDPEDIDPVEYVKCLRALKDVLRDTGASVKIALGGIYSL